MHPIMVGDPAPSFPEDDPLETLLLRIRSRNATIGVLGLGYVGLPLAVACAQTFERAIGFDVRHARVDQITRGQSMVQDVADGDIAPLVTTEKLVATTDFGRLRSCDVIVICVPTPLQATKEPDLSYITRAAESIAANIQPGQLVILESTTYPGTTDELLRPLLEKSGLLLDRDFLLAFSPERVDPGSHIALRKIAKVVGGCSELSTQATSDFYAAIVDVVHPVSNARAAETVKLLENTFRFVNIGFINEFSVLCEHLGIDSEEVIAAAATKPFGFMPFFPGPGIGGHCIPIVPLYLNWKGKQQGFVSRFIELADDVNTKMPEHVVGLVTKALNDDAKPLHDARILILGVAYKDNVADVSQSPATPIIDQLRLAGACVSYHDPLVPKYDVDLHGWSEWRPRPNIPIERRGLRAISKSDVPHRRRYDSLRSIALDDQTLESADCVLILLKHDDVDYAKVARHARLIVDTRNAISVEDRKSAPGKIVLL